MEMILVEKKVSVNPNSIILRESANFKTVTCI